MKKINSIYILYPYTNGILAIDKFKNISIKVMPNGRMQKTEKNNKGITKYFKIFGIRAVFCSVLGIFYTLTNIFSYNYKLTSFSKKIKKNLNINLLDIIIFTVLVFTIFLSVLLLGVLPIKLSFYINKSYNVFLKRFFIALIKISIIYTLFLILRFLPNVSTLYSFNNVCYEIQKEKNQVNFLVYFLCSTFLSTVFVSFFGVTSSKWYFILVNLSITFLVFLINYEVLNVLCKLNWFYKILIPISFLVVKKSSQTEYKCVKILEKEIELSNTKRDKILEDKNQMLFSEAYILAKEELQKANKYEKSDLDFIFCEILNKNRAELKLVKNISKEQYENIMYTIKQRAKGVPVTKIFGKTNFYGLDFIVSKDVLSPRMDTERLVECVLNNINKKSKVLDLCTGSGAIAVCLAKFGEMNVTASDISFHALKVAKSNAKNNNVKINFIQSDLFSKIKTLKKFDAIVSNPPYIKSEDIQNLEDEVKNHDPHIALDGGLSGYDFYEKIIQVAPQKLTKNGKLFLEIGVGQAKYIKKLLQKNFKDITIVKDYNKIDRVVFATVNK